MAPGNDFFDSYEGQIRSTGWRRYWKLLRLADAAADARLAPALKLARGPACGIPVQRILVAAVRSPGREADLDAVLGELSRTRRHRIETAVVDLQPMGKFDNINRAISGHNLENYDWLLVTDDDVQLPKDFVDLFIYFSYANRIKVAQPAHRFLSFASFRVTERHWGSLVRSTRFVEIGPISLLHRDTFGELLPSPSLRWAWGLDLFWSHVARHRGWRMGVVDATPIRHTRPVGATYSHDAARAEAVEFLTSRDIRFSRDVVSAGSERLQ